MQRGSEEEGALDGHLESALQLHTVPAVRGYRKKHSDRHSARASSRRHLLLLKTAVDL